MMAPTATIEAAPASAANAHQGLTHPDRLNRSEGFVKPTLDTSAQTNFWGKVRKTGTCWLWGASLNSSGYGQFCIRQDGREWALRAHRVAYELVVGPIPEGTVLDHICRVRDCVNPEHLRAVTPAENTLAGIGPSAINARKTHCQNGHEFTPENTYRIPKGGRACRACLTEDNRHRKSRQVACPECGERMRYGNLWRHQSRKHKGQPS